MVSAVVTGAGLSSRMISDLERNNLPIQNKLTHRQQNYPGVYFG